MSVYGLFICPDCKEQKSRRFTKGHALRCHECAVFHSKAWKREYNARYKARLQINREREELARGAPYSIAVRRIERLTGKPRQEWEWKSAHPLTKLAYQAARILAGLEKAA